MALSWFGAMLQGFVLFVALAGAALAPRRADDVTGTWDVEAKFSIKGGAADGQTKDMKAVLVLAQKATALSGAFTPYAEDGTTAQPAMSVVDGHVNGASIAFSVKQDAKTSLKFALRLVDGQLRGQATPSKDVAGGKMTITMIATRRK